MTATKLPATAKRVRIAESGNVWFRVTEGAMTGLWEPSAHNTGDDQDQWGYIGESQLHAKGTPIVEESTNAQR